MLITLDHQWTTPAWDGIKVLARLPDTPAQRAADPRPDADWRVFHFTRPRTALAILQTVLDRLDRHRQLTQDALLFSTAALDDATCAAARDSIAADPWHTALLPGPDNHMIEHLVIGPAFTGHRLFLQYIRNLSPIDGLDPADVLAQMNHYLGPHTI